jgi:hypothetical protein
VPTPGSVDVAGDSLTIQTFFRYGPGQGAPDDVKTVAGLGWKVGDVQPTITADVAAGRPAVLIVALGTNDSHPVQGFGWNGDDANAFRTLMTSPHPSACVVVVLPGYGAGISPAWRTEMDEARGALNFLAIQRGGRTVVADWQPIVQAHPEYLLSDGVHLRQEGDVVDARAAAARSQLYWSGMAACPA